VRLVGQSSGIPSPASRESVPDRMGGLGEIGYSRIDRHIERREHLPVTGAPAIVTSSTARVYAGLPGTGI